MAASTTSTLQIVSAAIPAVTGLLGVMVGGVLQWWQADSVARRQRAEADRKDNQLAEAAEAELARRRTLAAYPLALHLEAFAKQCAERVAHNTDQGEVDGWSPPSLGDYPATNWGALEPAWQVRLTDFASALLLRLNFIRGSVDDAADAAEARSIYARANAVIGLDAWSLAEVLRREAGIEAFKFHEDGWDYVEMMQHVVD